MSTPRNINSLTINNIFNLIRIGDTGSPACAKHQENSRATSQDHPDLHSVKLRYDPKSQEMQNWPLRFLRVTEDPGVFRAFDGPAWVDGYHFGDRLLEGVAFSITLTEEGEICAGVPDGHKKFLSNLNEKKWVNAATEFANITDFLNTTKALDDDSVVIYRKNVRHNEQASYFPDVIEIIEHDQDIVTVHKSI